MEIIIVIAVVFILWTQQSLAGSAKAQQKPEDSKEEKLAKALADYLKEAKGK
ncbi:MAG TPA: hypothetical protein IGR64_11215 [Leptolyngbyaceae cyanobacterium M65_K2018_010]|nr:hypothetical protein [Leptolyngbyaceae cyanobacterium M65_K2018_010]